MKPYIIAGIVAAVVISSIAVYTIMNQGCDDYELWDGSNCVSVSTLEEPCEFLTPQTQIFCQDIIDQKLTYLVEKKVINADMQDDLLIVYKIRNIYSHEIEIYSKKILDLLNKIKGIRDVTRFTENERIDKVREIVLKQVQGTFMDVLVRKQEKSENS